MIKLKLLNSLVSHSSCVSLFIGLRYTVLCDKMPNLEKIFFKDKDKDKDIAAAFVALTVRIFLNPNILTGSVCWLFLFILLIWFFFGWE